MSKHENRICGQCIGDDYLRAELLNVPSFEECHYCGETGTTVDVETLARRCEIVLDRLYTVTSLTTAVVYFDRTPEGEPLASILEEMTGIPTEAAEDAAQVLEGRWLYSSDEGSRYGDDPWFVETTRSSSQLSDAWLRMERSLRHEARFVNPDAMRVLENVFGAVLHDRTRDGQPVVVEVGRNREIASLYRARVFQQIASMEVALAHPERHLGPPPPGAGGSGRMNAKGVSVFYGATEKGIAIAEVRPPVGSHVVVADFEVVRELRLLDLQRLGSVGIRPGSSRFDPATLDHASRCGFLASLVQQLNMPVMPEAQDDGYLPTQVIADFLATHPKLELDGIIFTSTQIPTECGRNVILFPKASAVENAAESSSFEATVHLWEGDEDGMRFEPTICTPARAPETSSKAQLPRETTPALRLNRDTIEIHRVDAVLYTTKSFSVAHEVDMGPRGVKKY